MRLAIIALIGLLTSPAYAQAPFRNGAQPLEGGLLYKSLTPAASYRWATINDWLARSMIITPSMVESERDHQAVSFDTVATLPPSSEISEEQLSLDKQAVRDIQVRLMLLGLDPNGIDGVMGRGSRAAIRVWQETVGAEPTGYMNLQQYEALKEQSEGALEKWLTLDENAELHKQPPVIAMGPNNVPGNWRYTSRCGSDSRLGRMTIIGTLSMQHVGGGNYKGTLSNSQGQSARVTATLRGRTVSMVVNFGLLYGRVNSTGRVDEHQLVVRGRDSNGCTFVASK
jgi:peptidoglycan hydrolase-like protein with peptidoglycan-binding domain